MCTTCSCRGGWNEDRGKGSDVPGEAGEGVAAVGILLLGELLQATDAADTPFPHLDVEEDEDEEEQAGEEAVEEHGVEEGFDEV